MITRLILCLVPLVANAGMLSDNFIKSEMTDFYANPKEYYNKPIKKLKPGLKKVESLHERDQIRKKIMSAASGSDFGKSLPRSNDHVENLLRGYPIEKNIFTIKDLGFETSKTDVQAWSDDYWPIYKGILGARYAVDEYSYLTNWKEAFDYIESKPAPLIFKTGDANRIDKLSPSEKFDLLLSSDDQKLTKEMWKQGKHYHDNSPNGDIETWMGICHGWAPASYMVERPTKSIEVMSFDNKTKIKFYPADLKALATLLWASTDFETNFIGGRCNSSNPSEDSNGRLNNIKCLDTNPASFHLSLVNAIGAMGKSFVMDVTYDREVWNQPVVSYTYKYFNPLNKEPTNDLKSSIIAIEDFKDDPYARHRDKKVKYVVGISLEVTYGVETTPGQYETDSEDMDSTNTAYYFYDLELDENYNIIGGEWYNRDHPDFLWTPSYKTQALTPSDYYLLSREKWNGINTLPSDIKKLANHAAKRGSPLAYIVNSLIKLAL